MKIETLYEMIKELEMEDFNQMNREYSHYFKNVENLAEIDVYRVLELFEVDNPCLQHAIKKLLCAGGRGSKSTYKDVQEAIDALVRWNEMRKEELNDQ